VVGDTARLFPITPFTASKISAVYPTPVFTYTGNFAGPSGAVFVDSTTGEISIPSTTASGLLGTYSLYLEGKLQDC